MSNPIPKLLFEAKKLFNPLSEKALSLPDKEFESAVMYATSDERTEFLKNYYTKLSVHQSCLLVPFCNPVDLAKFLLEHYTELSKEIFHLAVDFSLLVDSDEFVRFARSAESKFGLYRPHSYRFLMIMAAAIDDRRFISLVESQPSSVLLELLRECHCKLSDERFDCIMKNIRVKADALFELFFKDCLFQLSDIRIRLMLKRIGLGSLDRRFSKNEDHLFHSAVLKIKSTDRQWFIYLEDVKCYSKLSDKRIILVVRADPRPLDELPWEMATRERQRLICILQESLDRIKARKAWIEANDSGINCFPIVQLVLACLRSLVKG
jgi:hypothetical protein